MHFLSLLALDVFGQHMLRYILCPSLAWEVFGQHKLRLCSYWNETGLVNSYTDQYVYVEMHYVLAFLGGFWFRYSFYRSLQEMRLFNTGSDAYCVPNGMGLVNAI